MINNSIKNSKGIKRGIGNIGEYVARENLIKDGFEIVEQNFQRRWGELDIIAKKDGILHFVEVKSVSGNTNYTNEHRPEDNVDGFKRHKIRRMIQTYLGDLECDTPFEFSVACVYLNMNDRKAKIKWIRNIIL
jgi:putative endonuclease